MVEDPEIDVLRPDPGTEADFQVDNQSFRFQSLGNSTSSRIPNQHQHSQRWEDSEGIERGLRTNVESGLSVRRIEIWKAVSRFPKQHNHSQKLEYHQSLRCYL